MSSSKPPPPISRPFPPSRAALLKADPEVPLFDVKSMPERVNRSVRDRKAAMVICLVFALLALALSAIGIYGVLAYTVAQRTREFGIRMALGASAGDVVGMVMKHGVRLAAIGLAIGIAGALAVTRLMATLLYGVRPTDPARLPRRRRRPHDRRPRRVPRSPPSANHPHPPRRRPPDSE